MNQNSEDFSRWFEEQQLFFHQTFQKHVNQLLPSFPSQLHDGILYVLEKPGKSIRPLLAFATATCLDIKIEEVLPIAMAIESIHIYSLTHDDLPAMDDDDLRRGRPTCHKVYDDATAILVGDGLQALAFEFLASSSLPDSVKVQAILILSQAAGIKGMVGGQMLDITSSNQGITHSIDFLDQLHRLKTGAIIEACITMVATIKLEKSSESFKKLQLFAKNIGLAFQIQDDILDITSNTELLGKPAGSDTLNDKLTYPSLIGLDNSRQRLMNLYSEAIQEIQSLGMNTELLEGLAKLIVWRKF